MPQYTEANLDSRLDNVDGGADITCPSLHLAKLAGVQSLGHAAPTSTTRVYS